MLATSETPWGGASGTGANGSGANGAGGPLHNDAPDHGHRPQIHHHDHHKQQKMPQAGMHGIGILAEGLGGISNLLTNSTHHSIPAHDRSSMRLLDCRNYRLSGHRVFHLEIY